MRIVIDLQGAQSTGSRNRGIGRYTLSIVKAIVRNREQHEIILALNGLFHETIEPIRADFTGVLPQENIRVWYAPRSVGAIEPTNDWRRKSAELVREAFFVNIKPDIILITSLFEGLVDDAVTSIGELSLNIPTAVILYDLIPFIHRHPYLENPAVESWYENKLDHFRRANLFLAISESSRQEGMNYLGLSEDMVVNISTAADPQFQQQSISEETERNIRRKYGLKHSYVMYTGGIDHRKNIEGLIRAYSSLPEKLRAKYQLAVVCSIQPDDETRLKTLAKKCKLKNSELVLTGFIPENDLIVLYGLCKVFVFPSWHEGFGLPALEAMACGCAVIGANTSSVPEVIGREDALFDPKSDKAIAKKLIQVLTDDVFRIELEQHGLEQAKKFSWDKSAAQVISAFERFYSEHQRQKTVKLLPVSRPKMAYISPLPPERSGISDYSAEILPELSRYYDIDVIVSQEVVSTVWVHANCQIRNVDWFKLHSDLYDRVLYHFGNSEFHAHMFGLLKKIPGVVILHDFFLSGIVAHMDVNERRSNAWTVELYLSHGYSALKDRFFLKDRGDVILKYPCNFSVLQNSLGLIGHSDGSCRMAKDWYGDSIESSWATIPLLRIPTNKEDKLKKSESKKLNIKSSDFIVSSFGMLGATKINHRLLDAWIKSPLSKDPCCKLIFIGENEPGNYGKQLLDTINRNELNEQVFITGWIDTKTYKEYLSISNIAVQLRTLSRGETSAAVLDCMNYGLATIVNANGNMADLSNDGVYKIEDNFTDDDLANALIFLWNHSKERESIGHNAIDIIHKKHAPRVCAREYNKVIEHFYYESTTNISKLIAKISELETTEIDLDKIDLLAQLIDLSIAPKYKQRQLFVDVSELVKHDSKTGIQRVVRSILKELLTYSCKNLRVEPVYATVEHGYRYARRFTLAFMDCPLDILSDKAIEYHAGDIFLGLDLQHQVVMTNSDFYQQMRRHGVQVQFVVYDLLCILMPEYFIDGVSEAHQKWLKVVAESDGAICISKSVVEKVNTWMKERSFKRLRPFNLSWFHLGADIENSHPSVGLPDNASTVIKALYKQPSFLMVGTIEPRKGYVQTLAAFEKRWQDGMDSNLVIVGKQGWMVVELIEKLHSHSELNKRLFWLEGISDEFLEKVYSVSTCLIAASEGEGFGLPLIEAAQHKLPIIARDISVFREVAGDHAFYFDGVDADSLSDTINEWLRLYHSNEHPKSEMMPWQTWSQSTNQLLAALNLDAVN